MMHELLRRSKATRPICVLFALAMLSSASSATTFSSVIYVSATGRDSSSGLDPNQAVGTIARALQISRQIKGQKTIYIDGRFVVTSPVLLGAQDEGLSLQAVHKGRALLNAASNVRFGIIISDSQRVKISQINFNGFGNDAISVHDSKSVSIVDNVVANTTSTAWSQGAIHFSGNVLNGLIEGNQINHADYAGIIVDTRQDSNVSGIIIRNNRLNDTCRRVADCGAIYINDRGKRSRSITISGNTVNDFGGGLTKGRAIYLDDFASNVAVTRNFISGAGAYAFQIHGGSNNSISGNIVDMLNIGQVILYEPVGYFLSSPMTNNLISENTFRNFAKKSFSGSAARLFVKDGDTLRNTRNRFCSSQNC